MMNFRSEEDRSYKSTESIYKLKAIDFQMSWQLHFDKEIIFKQ
jgi:hypothetical protein